MWTSDWINNNPEVHRVYPEDGCWEYESSITDVRFLICDTPPFDTSHDEGECDPVPVELNISGICGGPDTTPGEADETSDTEQLEYTIGAAVASEGDPLTITLGWDSDGQAFSEDDVLTLEAEREDGEQVSDAVEAMIMHPGLNEPVMHNFDDEPYSFQRSELRPENMPEAEPGNQPNSSQHSALPETEPGNVTIAFIKIEEFDKIKLTFSGPGDTYEQDVATLVPGACAGCQSACTPEAVNGSVSVTWPLGQVNGRVSASELVYYGAAPSADLATPAAWSLVGGGSAQAVYDANGDFRQAYTGNRLFDLTVQTPTRHTLSAYLASNVGAQGGDGVYATAGPAYATIVNDALAFDAEGAVTKVLSTYTNVTDNRTTRWVWEYMTDPVEGSGWVLADSVDAGGSLGSGVSQERLLRTVPDVNGERVQTRTIFAPDGQTPASKIVSTFRAFPWGEEKVKEVQNPDAQAWTTTYVYYDDPADSANYSELKLMRDTRGMWTYYTYAADGGLAEMITPLNQTPFDEQADLPTLRGANVSTVYTRFAAELGDADALDEIISKTQVFDAGVSERVNYSIRWSQSNPALSNNGGVDDPTADESWSIQGTTRDPEASYPSTTAFLNALLADADHLGHDVTQTQRHSGDHPSAPRQTRQRILDDGQVAFYTYPSTEQTIVERGYPNPAGDAVIHGSRTTTTLTTTGQPLSTYREMIDPEVNGGQWFTQSLTRTTQSDVFDRPLGMDYYFGDEAAAEWSNAGTGLAAYSTSQTYGCCGVETRTDRYGQVTSYMYDDLGRTTMMTRPDGVTLHYTYDAAGRQIKVEREGSGLAQTVDGRSDYDLAGRMTTQTDAGSKSAFYTYRQLKADGSAHDPATDTDPFYLETRVYPHNASAGPVRVTWTDAHGRSVLSLTGSVPTDWAGAAPANIEALSAVHRRVETDYDWADRVAESRSYHSFAGLPLASLSLPATPGGAVESQHFYVQPGGVYDAEGRMVRSKDVLGNITVTVYDDDGRPIATWVGTDDGDPTNSEAYLDPASLSGNLVQVAGSVYDVYDEMDQSLRLKPNLSSLGTFAAGADAIATDYDDLYTAAGNSATGRTSWSKPADGLSPWTQQVYDVQGRMVESITYPNGSTSFVLTRTTNVYDDTNLNGRMTASRVHEVDGNGGLTGNYLETTYAYDSAGRQFKTSTPGGGTTVNLYDAVGRMARSLVVADDNGTDTAADDLIATETVYGYDAADNVITTTVYRRRHDAGNGTGLLSDNPGWADPAHRATWYDDAHRPTHQVDYGDQSP